MEVQKASQTDRLKGARGFAIEAARLAANTRCTEVTLLEMNGLSPVCDYFVIATGTSARQMRSVGQELMELAESRGFRALSKSGLDSETWILVDCIDVVIHIFTPDSRKYYDLDNLWGDARHVDWQPKSKAK